MHVYVIRDLTQITKTFVVTKVLDWGYEYKKEDK